MYCVYIGELVSTYVCTYVLIPNSQDPNWYKARRKNGLEGMVPANYVMEVIFKPEALASDVMKEAQKKPPKVSQDSLPKTAVQLHKVP